MNGTPDLQLRRFSAPKTVPGRRRSPSQYVISGTGLHVRCDPRLGWYTFANGDDEATHDWICEHGLDDGYQQKRSALLDVIRVCATISAPPAMPVNKGRAPYLTRRRDGSHAMLLTGGRELRAVRMTNSACWELHLLGRDADPAPGTLQTFAATLAVAEQICHRYRRHRPG